MKTVAGTVTATPGSTRAASYPSGGLPVKLWTFFGRVLQPVDPALTIQPGGVDVSQRRLVGMNGIKGGVEWDVAVGDFVHYAGAPTRGYEIVRIPYMDDDHIEVEVEVVSP